MGLSYGVVWVKNGEMTIEYKLKITVENTLQICGASSYISD